MSNLKLIRAFKKAGIPDMPQTRRHILRNLEKVGVDYEKVSSTQLGYIIKALNIGYHDAKGENEADYMAGMDCVWIGGDVQALYPIKMFKEIKKETKMPPERGAWGHHRYTLDFTEYF